LTDELRPRAGVLTRQEAADRAGLIWNASYQVQLDFTQGEDTFACDTSISFESKPGTATFVDYTAPEVASIKLNGEPLDPALFDGERIRLEGLADRNNLSIKGRSAYMNTGVGLHRFVDPVDGAVYLHTQFEPFDAHRVFPCFDQPDIKGSFDIMVVAPDGWQVISNSPLQEWRANTPTGGFWKFHPTRPVSTYLTAIIAGPFEAIRNKHRDIDLGLMCRKSLLQYLEPDADEIFTITKQGFDFFEEAFGYPYVFGKYDQLFVPEFNHGAMENIGAVTFNEGAVFRSRVTEARRERRAAIILHEMAHMWFGDLVTMKWWDGLWLNESFATYQGTLSLAEATRFNQAWTRFAQGEKASAYSQDQLPTTHPIAADIPDTEATLSNFDAITYSKGASVLKQLVAWVGRGPFDEGIRDYFRKHEYGNTQLSDFLAPLEETSGRDLKAWSAEWLETAGVNTLSAEFETSGSGTDAKYSSFKVMQEAAPEWPTLRSHRAAVGLYDFTGTALVRRRRVELDVVGATTEVPDLIDEQPAALVLVNDDDLAYAKIRLDPASLQTIVKGVGSIEDSLARSLCWSAAWQMVRDAEMPARDYLQMVLANIATETDPGTMQNLISQAKSAAMIYGDPANRQAALASLELASTTNLDAAEPASDAQRIWAETLISSARTSDGLGLLKELLETKERFPGLAVDIGLRWQIVGALAETGVAGEELIKKELDRDPTDEGKRYWMMSRVSQPSAGAKEQGWRSFTEDTTLPLATLRAIAGGFQRHEQAALLTPYIDKYFEVLPGFWAQREPEVTRTFAAGMFPRANVSQAVIDKATTYIQTEAPPYALKRILLEAVDDMQRVIRARAKDASA